jgi:hypothetical protein
MAETAHLCLKPTALAWLGVSPAFAKARISATLPNMESSDHRTGRNAPRGSC